MTYNSDNLNITGATYSAVVPNIYDIYKEKKDPELFEKVVQDLILHKYADDDFKEVIELIDKRDVRLAIMSLIDKETTGDMNISWAEMKAYVDSGLSKMDHVKDVIKIINKFVKDGKTEKKKFGEVMTDISLVREMLDTLPKDVWSNPNLKWLDPCNGCGTFPFVIIYKLMKGLEEWEKDDEKRYKHIVENMIYTCELQSRNVFLWLCGVDPYDEYTTNTYWGSFLDEDFDKHMKEVWKVDKFDICLGNPPYNENNSNNNEKIYFKFINKSYKIIYDLSNLLYVLPDDSISYIVNKEGYYIKIINSNKIIDRFFKGIGTKIVFFLSIKSKNIGYTEFIDENETKKIKLSNDDLVLMNIRDTIIINNIKNKSNLRFKYNNAKFKGNNYRIRFSNIKKTKFTLRGIDLVCVDKKLLHMNNLKEDVNINSIYKYKVIDHSVDRIEYLSNSNFDNDKKRLCINSIGNMKCLYDENGEYLLTDNIIYIEVDNKNQADKIEMIINSNLLKYMQKVITHNTKNKFKVLNYFPKINLDEIEKEEDLFKVLEIEKEDIDYIISVL